MLGAFAVLWAWRNRPRPVGWLFGAYLVFAGIERFLVEILRAKDDRLPGTVHLGAAHVGDPGRAGRVAADRVAGRARPGARALSDGWQGIGGVKDLDSYRNVNCDSKLLASWSRICRIA